ncbi:MAG: hypothetical protein HN926_07165, partial [Chloroflexi bacterium]|nr:hypothetical protein [Chloroflexota bacterium]
MKNSDLHQKYVRLVTKQFLPINLRTFVICISLVLLVGLAGCKNVSDDAESITPAATNENVNDSSGADDNNAAEDQNNAPGSVTWATDQTNVLIRWYGREAAGLPVYEPELDNNPPTILPGSPSAPTLKVERRTLPGNTYEVIASGITRINDQSEAQDLIDSGDWWQEISTYVTNSQQIPAGEVNISNVYSAFDENPMAAEFWANSHHELALLLGMGFVDEELENGKKYQYRVSLEEANAETKIIGYTPHLKVGKQSDLPVEVYASSSAEEVFEADEIDESEVHDGNWLGDQAPRRWVNQSVYVGWKYPTQQNEESITASGYNIYRYAVGSDLEQIDNTNPLKINSNPVLPGGSGQGWLQDQQGESLLIGFDSETQQNQYDLESPTPPQANEDVDVLPGYFAVDDEPDPELEGNQLYCYAIAPIDFFGNEGPKTPENHQNGIDGNCATFQSQLPPEPPSNLIGQIHNAQIELQWDVIDGAD